MTVSGVRDFVVLLSSPLGALPSQIDSCRVASAVGQDGGAAREPSPGQLEEDYRTWFCKSSPVKLEGSFEASVHLDASAFFEFPSGPTSVPCSVYGVENGNVFGVCAANSPDSLCQPSIPGCKSSSRVASFLSESEYMPEVNEQRSRAKPLNYEPSMKGRSYSTSALRSCLNVDSPSIDDRRSVRSSSPAKSRNHCAPLLQASDQTHLFDPSKESPGASQRGRSSARFNSTLDDAGIARMRILAVPTAGVVVTVEVVTDSPFHSSSGYIWGSAWVAHWGSEMIARGSCSAITYYASAAQLAGVQEAILGVHNFLSRRSIDRSCIKIVLSFRAACEQLSLEVSETAVAHMFASLAGGIETVRALVLKPVDSSAPFPAHFSIPLKKDFLLTASDAANSLRSDLKEKRAGSAIAADFLPGVRLYVQSVQGPLIRFPSVATADSLHGVGEFGDNAGIFRELTRLRSFCGVLEGVRLLFRLAASGSDKTDAALAIPTFRDSHEQSEALFLARRNFRIRDATLGGSFGDLAEAACSGLGDASKLRLHLRRVALLLSQRSPTSYGSLSSPFESLYSLRHYSSVGQGGSQCVSRLEGFTVATFLGSEVAIWSLPTGSETIFCPEPYPSELSAERDLLLSSCGLGGALPFCRRFFVERPSQGCTVVEVVPASPGTSTGLFGSSPSGLALAGSGATQLRAHRRAARADFRGAGAWECPICMTTFSPEQRVGMLE